MVDAGAPPVLLGGTVPAAGGASTSLSLPRQDWWEKWWDLAAAAPDTAKLQSIFGPKFDVTTTLRTYINTSAQPPAVIWAAFQLTPKPRKGGPDVFGDLSDAGWLLDAVIQLQQRDPTYALAVLLDNITLRDMAYKCVPVKALFFRIPDALTASASTFRDSIPPCDGLKINARPDGSVTKGAAAEAKKSSDRATAKAAKNPKDDRAQKDAQTASFLSLNAIKNAAVAALSLGAVNDVDATKAAKKKAAAENKKHPSDANQAALQSADDAVKAAQEKLNDLGNDNLLGGWMYMGSNQSAEPAPPDSADMPVKRMYWAEKTLFREGGWDAINTYDGTFTYGSGWNMTSGEGGALFVGLAKPATVVLRKPECDDPTYVSSFVAGCANTCTFFKKCGIWFDDTMVRACGMTQNNMRILHIDDSGAGYIVDNSQLCRKPNLGLGGVPTIMGCAYKYLAMNRKLVEAFICAGSTKNSTKRLPDEDQVPDGTRMPSPDVMRTVQLRLFERNRMAHFKWSAACATQASFFLLVHANHFGAAYAEDAIIQFGISSKLVPAVTSNTSPGAGYVKLASGLWLLPSPSTDIKIARAAITYMTALSYNKKNPPHVNYDGSSKSYSVQAFFDLWSAFVHDITNDFSQLGEKAYSPPPPPSSSAPDGGVPDGGPDSGPASTPDAGAPDSGSGPDSGAAPPFPAPLDPNAPEPTPIQPWRQQLETAIPAGTKDSDKPAALVALETGAAKDWIIVRGRSAYGWEDVHYVTIPKAVAP